MGILDVPGVSPAFVKNRLRNWAQAFVVAGLRDVSAMASPPTVTYPNVSTSALNASSNAAGLPAAGKHPQLAIAGANTYDVDTANSNATSLRARGPLNTDGSSRDANLMRARFTCIQPAFEVCFKENQGARINALVTDELAGVRKQFIGLYDGRVPAGLQSGNTRYMKVDFGANVLSYGMAASNVSAGGTGHAVGDTITMSGGTFVRPATFRVRVATSGVVSALTILDPGQYSVLPAFPAATTSSGAGTGLTIATGFTFPIHSTARPRNIELLVENAQLYGINYATWTPGEAVITPYRYNQLLPKVYWLGDSQDAATYGVYAGGEIPFLTCLRMGLADNLTIEAQGGTGFNCPNGVAPAFEHANRINAIIAAAPDIVIFPYSQNVTGNTQATSQAAALAFVTALQSALPRALFIMIGPAFGFQTWHQAAMQYVMANAPDARRIRLVDTVALGMASGSNQGFLTTDNVHWGVFGNYAHRSVLLAEEIGYNTADMIL